MSRAKVQVQHFVACLEVRVDGPVQLGRPCHLTDVSPVYGIPADRPYPVVVPRLDLFTRFFVREPGAADFEVRVVWLDGEGGRPERLEVYGPWSVVFQPGESMRDFLFRVVNVPLHGPGRYAFRLRDLNRRRTIAAEYLEIVPLP